LLALYHPENRELSLHDLKSGAVVLTVPDVDTLPDGDLFSPDGQWLAYGVGSELRLLDLSTGETAVALNEYPKDQIITRVIWSPDGEALIGASAAPDDSPGLVILWEKTADESFVPAHQAISVRSGYTRGVTIAAFSPSGRRVAFELLPDFEASSLAIEVYDRQERELIFRVEEYELNAWITDDLLMASEGQYYTRLTRWDVVNNQKTGSTAPSPSGGEVYAPNGQYYADTSNSGANIGRAIKVASWESSQDVARVSIGNDVNTLRWSPDGRWLAALVSDSSLWLLPVTFSVP
jgi:WD40 repeat protein